MREREPEICHRENDWQRAQATRTLQQWTAIAAVVAGCTLLTVAQQARAQVTGEYWLHIQLAQAGGAQQPRIAVLSTVVAAPSSQMPLQIEVAPSEAIPRKSFLRVRGLPPTASLSEGHSIAPGAWAVPLNGLPRLILNLPAAVSGKSELIITLVGEDGAVLAESQVSLVIQPGGQPAESGKAAAPAKLNRPEPPALTPADREAAEKLLARGERDLEQGNVAQARQFFLRAAQAGLARAALLLASTYDPRQLARMGAVGVQANVAEARKWYSRAAELGEPEGAERLATLGGS
jgi:hypothetical protein